MLTLVACSSQPPTVKQAIGKGAGDPFWTDIANKSQTGGAASAVEWAKSFENGQSNAGYAYKYNGLCLEFVANAYGAAYSTYETAWDLASASTLNDPTNPAAAPTGALMFFDLSGKGIPEGHVGLSLGGGAMISSHEESPYVRITANVQSDSYFGPTYRGWAWPPSMWGTLAQQAANEDSGGTGGSSKAQVLLEGAFTTPQGDPYAIYLTAFPANTPIQVTCYDSARPGGFHTFTMTTDGSGQADSENDCYYSINTSDHWVVADGVESNHVFWIYGGGSPVDETAGGRIHTWTDYVHAGGTQGPSISAQQTVQIACKVTGFKVQDGDTWWYRIASSPWDSTYYASADSFYNNGATSGSLYNTPPVDWSVPTCTNTSPTPTPRSAPTFTPTRPTATPARPTPPPYGPTVTPTFTPTPIPAPPTWAETAGGNAHTWTNYTNAGGTEGPTVPAYATIQIACRLQGFKVQDGNTWWYRIAQSPWSNQYYVSADAFYNNGQTSGSLQGTPFVDNAVALC